MTSYGPLHPKHAPVSRPRGTVCGRCQGTGIRNDGRNTGDIRRCVTCNGMGVVGSEESWAISRLWYEIERLQVALRKVRTEEFDRRGPKIRETINVTINDPDVWRTVLNVGPKATEAEIKESYRKLVKQHHPDHGGDARTCQIITLAYRQLQSRKGTP